MTSDLDAVQTLEVVVEGQRLRVRLDAKGRPLTVGAVSWAGGDAQRIAHLAVRAALAELTLEAERKAKAERDRARTGESTQTKRKRAAAFWGNDWLRAAHERNPRLSARRLALAARNLIEDEARRDPEFNKNDQYKHRAQINEYRAGLFLRLRRPA